MSVKPHAQNTWRYERIDAQQSVENDGKITANLIPQFRRSSLVAEDRVGDTISRLEGTVDARLSAVYGRREIRVSAPWR